MKLRHRRATTPPAESKGDVAGRLAGIRPVGHDEDADRPRREDVTSGGSPFDIPVPLPRILLPKGKRNRPK